VGQFVITMPAASYARDLWRLGEPGLARRAAEMTPSDCAAVGERAGHLHQSGAAAELWPTGPSGVTRATMLAVTEHLEGTPRPCGRSRRLPEKSLPTAWRLTEDERWQVLEPVARAMDARLQRGE
jgi:hypothetical protein